MEILGIQTPYIQLNQCLKLAGFAENGADANALISSGAVKVDGITELRKRNKIYPGMVVSCGEHSCRVEKETAG